MSENPYKPPADGTAAHTVEGARLMPRKSRLLIDLSIVTAIFLAASFAVPFLDRHRRVEAWGASVALFAGAPLISALLLGPRSHLANWSTGALLLVCPVVYGITDALPAKYEVARDVVFLATASLVVFISMSWVTAKSPSRKRTRKIVGTLGAITGIAAVYIMTWLFTYLE